MARTAQVDSPTKGKLLCAAQNLIVEQGFAATTVDAICEKAGVTKGSFFHYFKSKDDLGKQVLKRFCASGVNIHAEFCGRETDPLKRVYAYIDGIIAMSQDPQMNKGCLLGLFSQECCDTNAQIREVCRKAFDDWAGHFGEVLAKAKAKYAPKAAFKPKEIAEHMIAVLEGSLIIGKTRKDMAIVAQNLGHFKAYVKSLFP